MDYEMKHHLLRIRVLTGVNTKSLNISILIETDESFQNYFNMIETDQNPKTKDQLEY